MRSQNRSYIYIAGIGGLFVFILLLGFLYSQFGPIFPSQEADGQSAGEQPAGTAVAGDPAGDESDQPAGSDGEVVGGAEQSGDERTTVTISEGQRVHIVLPGESVPDIALAYGLIWTDLADYNDIANLEELQAGDMLIIPPTTDDGGDAGDSGVVEGEVARAGEDDEVDPASGDTDSGETVADGAAGNEAGVGQEATGGAGDSGVGDAGTGDAGTDAGGTAEVEAGVEDTVVAGEDAGDTNTAETDAAGTVSDSADVDGSGGDTTETDGSSDTTSGEGAVEEGTVVGGEPATPTLGDLVFGDVNFESLAALLTAAGLRETLTDREVKPLTLFAPTDAAFETLPADVFESLLADPSDGLTTLLALHMARGEILSADMTEEGALITAGGETVTVTVVDGTITLNGTVQILLPNIQFSNGVLHIIDTVMQPSESEVASGESLSGEFTEYEVQPGDTLGSISAQFGVSAQAIAQINQIPNPNRIYAGQLLTIPAEEPDIQAVHTVRAGETLFIISLKYPGVTWQQIAEANDVEDPYVIYAGDTLLIPLPE